MTFPKRYKIFFLSALCVSLLTPSVTHAAASSAKKPKNALAGKWAFDHTQFAEAQCRLVDAKSAQVLLNRFFCKEGWIASSNEDVWAVCTERNGGSEFLLFESRKDCEQGLDRLFREANEE